MQKREPTNQLLILEDIRAKLKAGATYVLITDDPRRDHRRLYKAIARREQPVPWKFATGERVVYVKQRAPSRRARLSQRDTRKKK